MEMLTDIIKAFAVGGALCVIAQILIDKTALTPARILVAYVTVGVILTGAGVYGKLVDFAGCGATLPLTGFGYALASGVKNAVDERGIIGALTGGITGTAGGIAAAITFGYIFSVVFSAKPKK
ncbi:MAG: stage V sporulation protein AE [Clostridiales bacterium]|nr:stage V sporulation protein AE [Clostridiales bacterium]